MRLTRREFLIWSGAMYAAAGAKPSWSDEGRRGQDVIGFEILRTSLGKGDLPGASPTAEATARLQSTKRCVFATLKDQRNWIAIPMKKGVANPLEGPVDAVVLKPFRMDQAESILQEAGADRIQAPFTSFLGFGPDGRSAALLASNSSKSWLFVADISVLLRAGTLSLAPVVIEGRSKPIDSCGFLDQQTLSGQILFDIDDPNHSTKDPDYNQFMSYPLVGRGQKVAKLVAGLPRIPTQAHGDLSSSRKKIVSLGSGIYVDPPKVELPIVYTSGGKKIKDIQGRNAEADTDRNVGFKINSARFRPHSETVVFSGGKQTLFKENSDTTYKSETTHTAIFVWEPSPGQAQQRAKQLIEGVIHPFGQIGLTCIANARPQGDGPVFNESGRSIYAATYWDASGGHGKPPEGKTVAVYKIDVEDLTVVRLTAPTIDGQFHSRPRVDPTERFLAFIDEHPLAIPVGESDREKYMMYNNSLSWGYRSYRTRNLVVFDMQSGKYQALTKFTGPGIGCMNSGYTRVFGLA